MSEIVIYGGTFNPIHRGHVALCRYLLEELGYARLLLIPAASPPHKEAPQLAPGEARLELCRLAVAGLPGVEVLDWELLRGGRSYTIDTVRYLTRQHPGDRLSLLMGSDMFLTFRQWKDWRALGELVTLLVASRETDDRRALEEQRSSLLREHISARLLENPVTPLSSTQVRECLRAGEGEGLVPEPVLAYIRAHGLYGEYDLAALRAVIQPLESKERYHHSLCVERRAVQLARRYGGEENRAAAAAILHDICKNMPQDRLLQMVGHFDIMNSIDFQEQPQLLHGFAGALYIQEQLGILDSEIIHAVCYHTTGRAGMSLLEQIIYLADLTSEERDYPDVELLRRLAEQSLEEAMLYALRYIVEESLPRRGFTPCALSLEALREYEDRATAQQAQVIDKKKQGGAQ